jgi:hypothetical protein
VSRAELDAWIRRLPPAERRPPAAGAGRTAWYEGHLRALALHEMLLTRAAERPGESEPDAARASRPEFPAAPRAERRLVHHWYRRARDPEAVAAAREELAALVERHEAGEPFADLARSNSDSQSRHVGGALGWLEREQLPAPAADVVFSLRVGEPSDPVQVGPGLHVFRVEQVLAAKAPGPARAETWAAAAAVRPPEKLRAAVRELERAVRERVTEAELHAWHARHRLRFATPLQLRLERTWLPAAPDPDAEMAWLERWAAGAAPDAAALRERAVQRGGGREELPWQTWAEVSAKRPTAALLVAQAREGEVSPPYRVVRPDGTEALEIVRVLGRREPAPQRFQAVADDVARAWLESEGSALWQEIGDGWLEAAGYRVWVERLPSGPASASSGAATTSSSNSARSSREITAAASCTRLLRSWRSSVPSTSSKGISRLASRASASRIQKPSA